MTTKKQQRTVGVDYWTHSYFPRPSRVLLHFVNSRRVTTEKEKIAGSAVEENMPDGNGYGWFQRTKRHVKGYVTSPSTDRSLAIVLFLVFLAISLTCVLSRCLSASQPKPFPKYVFLALVMGYEVFSVVCFVLMMRYARCQPAYGPSGKYQILLLLLLLPPPPPPPPPPPVQKVLFKTIPFDIPGALKSIP